MGVTLNGDDYLRARLSEELSGVRLRWKMQWRTVGNSNHKGGDSQKYQRKHHSSFGGIQ